MESVEAEKTKFKDEVKRLVAQKCNEINHYISGCTSPFRYIQIREVQNDLCEICDVLGIKEDDRG